MSTSVLIEMGQVLRAVPGPNAPIAEVARWYVAKAALLEHVAADLRTRTDEGGAAAAQAAFQAAGARLHAAQLRATACAAPNNEVAAPEVAVMAAATQNRETKAFPWLGAPADEGLTRQPIDFRPPVVSTTCGRAVYHSTEETAMAGANESGCTHTGSCEKAHCGAGR